MNARRLSGIDASIDRKSWLEWFADVEYIVSLLEANPNLVRACADALLCCGAAVRVSRCPALCQCCAGVSLGNFSN